MIGTYRDNATTVLYLEAAATEGVAHNWRWSVMKIGVTLRGYIESLRPWVWQPEGGAQSSGVRATMAAGGVYWEVEVGGLPELPSPGDVVALEVVRVARARDGLMRAHALAFADDVAA